ncbi:MAG: molybdopterin dinucleotide binding domain-containing protein, partial [Dermatophilaceae bacterium]
MGTLDAYVAVDFFVNETTRHAHVILPPTGPLERDHYDLVFHLLAVRDTARWSPALYPRQPGARHDWEIARDLGLAVLAERRRRASRERSVRNSLRGIRSGLDRSTLFAVARLRMPPARQLDLLLRTGGGGLSLRKVAAAPNGLDLGPLRPRLPGRLRTPDRRVDIAVRTVLDALPELLRAGDPGPGPGELLLVGRRHQRDNNSWLHNAPRLTRGRPRHALLAHPDDLAVRGIRDGDVVRVRSASGEVGVEVAATDDVMRGVVSLPHGYGHARPGVRMTHAVTLPGVSANDLTDPAAVDPLSGNAVLNGVPVTVEPVVVPTPTTT